MNIKRIVFNCRRKFKAIYYKSIVIKKAKACGGDLKVNGRSSVTKHTVLGDNVNFNGIKITGGGKVVIGNNFHSGEDCLLISQNHNFDHGTKIPYDNTYILKDIIIEDQVWLGSRVIVLGGVTIGEGAIIQAGSVVTTNIPKFAIAGGHPAKVFSTRNVEHYNKCKSEKAFH